MSGFLSEATNIDAIQVQEQSSVTQPSTGYGKFYFKDDGKPYAQNDGGTETDLTSGGGGSSTPNFGSQATKTISSGVVATGSDRSIIVAAESGTADDLVEITGLTIGDKLLLVADSGDTITVKHNSGSATIKILIQDDADFDLDENHPLELVLLSTNVLAQVYDEAGGSGGGISTHVEPLGDIGATATTSATYIDVANTDFSYTVVNGELLVTYHNILIDAAASGVHVRIVVGADNGADYQFDDINAPNVTLVQAFTGISAGSVTVKMQMKSVSGGTSTVDTTDGADSNVLCSIVDG